METVSPYLTSGNIALVALILIQAFRVIAPKTKTTVDDKILNMFDNGTAWLKANAPDSFNKVEALALTGAFSGGAAKLAAYLWDLNVAHIEDHGTPLPVEMIEAAQRAAAGLDAEDKVKRAAPAAAAAMP